MNVRDRNYLNATLERARTVVPVAGARVAATLVLKRGNVFYGKNSLKTHPLQAEYCKNPKAICLHAEVDAMKNALRFFNQQTLWGSSLYIARAKADGSPGLAKPCEGCCRAIAAFEIGKVVYTE